MSDELNKEEWATVDEIYKLHKLIFLIVYNITISNMVLIIEIRN